MKRLFLIAIATFMIPTLGLAQSAIGTWAGEAQGRGGPQQVTLTLEDGDGAVKGTWTQGDQVTDLTEVTVDGNEISFQRMLAGRGGGAGVTATYNGVVDGDQLTLTMSVAGRGGPGGPGRGGPGGAAPGDGGRGPGGRGGPGPIVLTRQ